MIPSLLTLAALIIILTNEVFQQRLGVSPMPTMRGVRREMIALIPENTGAIVELGSGWGGLARDAARRFPAQRVTGIEGSFFPYHFSRLMNRRKNLSFARADFFSTDLSAATTILCYLSNAHMARLEEKFMRELPVGAVIVSSTFPLPHWEPVEMRTLKGLWRTQIYAYRKTA